MSSDNETLRNIYESMQPGYGLNRPSTTAYNFFIVKLGGHKGDDQQTIHKETITTGEPELWLKARAREEGMTPESRVTQVRNRYTLTVSGDEEAFIYVLVRNNPAGSY